MMMTTTMKTTYQFTDWLQWQCVTACKILDVPILCAPSWMALFVPISLWHMSNSTIVLCVSVVALRNPAKNITQTATTCNNHHTYCNNHHTYCNNHHTNCNNLQQYITKHTVLSWHFLGSEAWWLEDNFTHLMPVYMSNFLTLCCMIMPI